MKRLIHQLGILSLATGLTACNTLSTQKESTSYQLEERPAFFETISDTNAKTGRVIIQIRTPIEPDKAPKLLLLQHLKHGLDKDLAKISGVTIDRALSESINSEIELSEFYGKDAGRQDADYVMLVNIDDYYVEEKQEKKKKLFSEEMYHNCELNTHFKGWVRLQTLPALEVVNQWDLDEEKSTSFDVGLRDNCARGFKQELTSLHKEMLEKSLCKSRYEYQNGLAPTGHVISTSKDGLLINSSLNTQVGIEENDNIVFYHHPSEKPYAKGVVVSVNAQESQIRIKSINEKEPIYQDDWVRPHYPERNLLNCLF